jgi:uncharacterized membrane protein YdjX (TVP38/TMEM64 family)
MPPGKDISRNPNNTHPPAEPPSGDPSPSKRKKKGSILSLIGFPLLFAVLIALIFVFRKSFWQIFSSPEQLRDWVSGLGAAAPLAFIGLQILQVVIFIIPGEVPQVAAGYLFGFWKGTILSVSGIAIGSAINFWLARWLGVPFIQHLFKQESIEKVNSVAESSHARIGFFLLFLIPGIPKDILCYVAGLSSMSFFFFMAISGLGRLPGIVGSTIMGTAAAEKRWVLFIAITAATVALFLIGFLFKDRIHEMILRMTKKKPRGADK